MPQASSLSVPRPPLSSLSKDPFGERAWAKNWKNVVSSFQDLGELSKNERNLALERKRCFKGFRNHQRGEDSLLSFDFLFGEDIPLLKSKEVVLKAEGDKTLYWESSLMGAFWFFSLLSIPNVFIPSQDALSLRSRLVTGLKYFLGDTDTKARRKIISTEEEEEEEEDFEVQFACNFEDGKEKWKPLIKILSSKVARKHPSGFYIFQIDFFFKKEKKEKRKNKEKIRKKGIWSKKLLKELFWLALWFQKPFWYLLPRI